ELVQRYECVQSISRVLLADKQWSEVLTFAKSSALKYIVSNATESSYVLDARDQLDSSPPDSIAGKLAQVLWSRYQAGAAPVKVFDHPAIRLADDIAPFFLRKVRILNGTHTAMVGKFHGKFALVQDLLADKAAARWIRDLMYGEIVPTLAHRLDLVAEFADHT